MAEADQALTQWQYRVYTGRTVAKFADRVQHLLRSIVRNYTVRTSGTLSVKERADRLTKLINYVSSVVEGLFRQQMILLQATTVNHFRKKLQQLSSVSSIGLADDGSIVDNSSNSYANEEAIKERTQSLRTSLFDFKMIAAEYEVEEIPGLNSDSSLTELTATLESLMKDFSETPTSKIDEIRKIERIARANPGPRRKKNGSGKSSVNVVLNLVGMLRPPGYGNLQGFLGYATGILGLPLELLLGVQNDGDSPEVIIIIVNRDFIMVVM